MRGISVNIQDPGIRILGFTILVVLLDLGFKFWFVFHGFFVFFELRICTTPTATRICFVILDSSHFDNLVTLFSFSQLQTLLLNRLYLALYLPLCLS